MNKGTISILVLCLVRATLSIIYLSRENNSCSKIFQMTIGIEDEDSENKGVLNEETDNKINIEVNLSKTL